MPSQPLQEHFTKSTSKMFHDFCLNDSVLSVSRKQCQISVTQMTDGKWDLISRRNVSIEEAALVSGGRLFHARAAVTGNMWSLRFDRQIYGTTSIGESTER